MTHSGTTPAQAGKTRDRQALRVHVGDYPRAGGEDPISIPAWARGGGLPPRRRGRHPLQPPAQAQRGTTPAQAGKTAPRSRRRPCSRDYPRAGGEDSRRQAGRILARGLPPRRRGRRAIDKPYVSIWGTTPAQAGKTISGDNRRILMRDYPRAGGEDVITIRHPRKREGLPPRRRGRRRRGPSFTPW